MKIGFDLQLDEAPLFVRMAQKLFIEHGVEVSGVTLGGRWSPEIKASNIKPYNISEFMAGFFKKFLSPSEIEIYVKKFGDLGLIRAMHIDRFLGDNNRETLQKWIIGHLKFYEEYFERERPDFFVGPGIAFLTHLAAYLVGKTKDIPYLAMLTTRTPDDRFAVCRNLHDRWDLVYKIYKELNAKSLLPSKDAQLFIKEFREKPVAPAYMKLPYQKRTIQKTQIKKFFSRLKLYYLDGWGDFQFDYYTHSPFYYVRRDLSKIVKSHLAIKSKMFSLFHEYDKFVLFPLHLQPEASTMVMARFFVDQVAVVENIAKCIPLSHVLYVKEHMSALGMRKRQKEYYQRISRIPNVRLIHPAEDTQMLIRKADAVVTLTSTMGWEALLHGKPVISMGDVFYNDSGLTYRIRSYDELETLLPQILNKNIALSEDFGIKLGRFIDAIFQGTHKGNFHVPGLNPNVMDHRNVELLVKGLLADIKAISEYTTC